MRWAKNKMRQSRLLRPIYVRLYRTRRSLSEGWRVGTLRMSRQRLTSPLPGSNEVIASLTSFPARIDDAWIVIEAMMRQDRVPDRVVLVLSEREFSSRELPRRLMDQQRRGLEVVWVDNDNRSLNKLVPTRAKYPEAAILTVDDDALYEPWVLSRLLGAAQENPQAVIGHRGWEIQEADGQLLPYNGWTSASATTPSASVFLTGVGGVLYPPGALPIDLLSDIELARRLCPTNDDIWFWAVERVAGVRQVCLGLESCRALSRQSHTPRLATINRDERQNDVQLANVVEHFGLGPVTRAGDTLR